jgi:hypothetical protein
LEADRSDSDDEEPKNVEEEAEWKARKDKQKDKALAEYNKSVEWSVAMGASEETRRLSVMMRAHGANEAEEETETYFRAVESKKWAVTHAQTASTYALSIADKAEQAVLMKVLEMAGVAAAVGRESCYLCCRSICVCRTNASPFGSGVGSTTGQDGRISNRLTPCVGSCICGRSCG